jgi:hypothetical protein
VVVRVWGRAVVRVGGFGHARDAGVGPMVVVVVVGLIPAGEHGRGHRRRRARDLSRSPAGGGHGASGMGSAGYRVARPVVSFG